jgi:ABC-type uncharacterized transport system substrate-binding protein
VNRRDTITALAALGATVAPWGVRAQSKEKPRRIGFLGISNPVAAKTYIDAFSDAKAKLGWIEGRSIVTDYAFAHGDISRLDALAANLVARKPDLIFTTAAEGALALQRATRTIPIVFANIPDPVAAGLVKTLSHPGGNLTGTAAMQSLEIIGKRLQLLKEWLPRLSRVAVILNPGDANDAIGQPELRRSASLLGIQVTELNLTDTSDINSVFDKLHRDKPQALYVSSNAVAYTHRETICRRVLTTGLPSVSSNTQFVESGCLFAYAVHQEGNARLAVTYIDKILRGAKPGDLPVQQPIQYELVVNAKTANALGLTIPQSLLQRADRVIE